MTTPHPWDGTDGPGDGHPREDDVDALLDADLAEVRDRGGPQGPPPEALVAAHVLGCTRCRHVLEDMRGVRELLRARAAGAPPPPRDLQARIAAAVAHDAERERRAGRRRRRRTAFALAASGVVVAGLGTAVALSAGPVLGGGGADSAGGGAAGGEAARAGVAPVVMASGTDYLPGQVGPQLDEAVAHHSGTPADLAPGEAAGASGQGGTDPKGTDPDGSGTAGSRTEGSVPGGAAPDRAPGATQDGAPEPADVPADVPGDPSGLSDPDRLAACLDDLGRSGAVVLAVDTARWEGRPADVLVVEAPGAPGGATSGTSALGRPVQVWVVAPGCAGGEEGLRHYEVLG
ncbi:hypothetical protein WDZ17_10890 [Pseudokineococcus basanitobsidens]|uniref:Zinc finger protein n=1 Tax=Pseudokineococcus basanitobsidens TaxID=1926649 RepID=A0ABU8RL44_9ACTN